MNKKIKYCFVLPIIFVLLFVWMYAIWSNIPICVDDISGGPCKNESYIALYLIPILGLAFSLIHGLIKKNSTWLIFFIYLFLFLALFFVATQIYYFNYSPMYHSETFRLY